MSYEIFINATLFVIGLAVLLKGADFFTESSATIARKIGVSDIVIGMTLVAFATSIPELAVSLTAAFENAPGIALGNVLGSNIANIGLVLAILILISKVGVNRESRKGGAVMLLALILASALIINGINQLVGALLFSMIVFYVVHTVVFARPAAKAIIPPIEVNMPKLLVLLAIGLGGIILGGRLVVDSAIHIAKTFGISEILIGVTVIAIGTSLPELTTSLIAAKKGYSDLAIGNLIGSNLFNITAILGAAAIISPIAVTKSVIFIDIPFMLLLGIILVALMHENREISRVHGIVFLAIYALFIFMQTIRFGG